MSPPSPNTNFLSGTAKSGPYQTPLNLIDELHFQHWAKTNGVIVENGPKATYDMRGFWKAAMQGDPQAVTQVNPYDNKIHFPDVWKTPYHPSFSNESIYATPNAPSWTGDDDTGWMLKDKLGNILVDERVKKK